MAEPTTDPRVKALARELHRMYPEVGLLCWQARVGEARELLATIESELGPLVPVREVVGWTREQFWFPATPAGVAAAIDREFDSTYGESRRG